jgi:transcriptional regulator with GAF, ATPase, and Fis domain
MQKDNLLKKNKELQERIHEYEVLFKILNTISSTLSSDEILKILIKEILSLCRTPYGSILLFEPKSKDFSKTLIRDNSAGGIVLDRFLNNVLAGWVNKQQGKLVCHNLETLISKETAAKKYRKISSIISIPLKVDKKIIGIINVVSTDKRHPLAAREVHLLELLAKPCAQFIVNAHLQESLFAETQKLRMALEKKYSFHGIIGQSPAIQKIFKLLERIIDTDVRILIEGESGTGKELIAKVLHYGGPNKEGPFIGGDCGALPDNLFESELFGYVKGAFTGADKDKPGLFDEACGGTLFLDEISNIPLDVQSKLLRVLQEGEIRPVGSTKTHKINTRLIAAASADLHGAVNNGRFREDLYYRLKVIPIALPPLRERREDILLLANFFLKKLAKKYAKGILGFKAATTAALEAYDWPGNIRELENVVERLVVLMETGQEFIPEDLLPLEMRSGHDRSLVTKKETTAAPEQSLKKRSAGYEKYILLSALENSAWHQSAAAKKLGIAESTLRSKMQRLGIKRPKILKGSD